MFSLCRIQRIPRWGWNRNLLLYSAKHGPTHRRLGPLLASGTPNSGLGHCDTHTPRWRCGLQPASQTKQALRSLWGTSAASEVDDGQCQCSLIITQACPKLVVAVREAGDVQVAAGAPVLVVGAVRRLITAAAAEPLTTVANPVKVDDAAAAAGRCVTGNARHETR